MVNLEGQPEQTDTKANGIARAGLLVALLALGSLLATTLMAPQLMPFPAALALVSLALGILGLIRARTVRRGKGTALWAIAVSLATIGLFFLLVVLWQHTSAWWGDVWEQTNPAPGPEIDPDAP